MTRPLTPPTVDMPDADRREIGELEALYREGSTAEPGPVLDQRILAAAKAELANDHRRSKPSRPWWKVLLVPTATVAIGVLGISLAWRVVDQQERELRATMNAAETQAQSPAAPVGTTSAPAPSELAAAPAPSPNSAEARKSRNAAKSGKQPLPVQAPKAFPEQKLEAPASEPQRLAAPASAAPAQAGELALKKSSADVAKETVAEDSAAVASGRAAAAPAAAAPMAAARADRNKGSAEKETSIRAEAAAAPDDAATPEDWLRHIRELRAAGRDADAAQSLARFRLRYPDHAVPGDLVQPK